MKLAELNLKSKPQTKYFDGGYISFQTREGELYFKIYQVTKESHNLIYYSNIKDRQQLDNLMKVTSVEEGIEA